MKLSGSASQGPEHVEHATVEYDLEIDTTRNLLHGTRNGEPIWLQPLSVSKQQTCPPAP